MMNTVTETVVNALENVVQKVEQLDSGAAERPVYYGRENSNSKKQVEQQDENNAAEKNEEDQVATSSDNMQKLKLVAGDLIDLWLYEGSKGMKYVQESRAYKATDPYVHYFELYESIKDKSVVVADKLGQLNEKVVLFIDDSRNYVGMLVQVIKERQGTIIEYVQNTYDNVLVSAKDNWMRLDFNKDGQVTADDLRRSLNELYEFLKSYDYIEASTKITSTIYEEAKKLLKSSKQQQEDKAEQEPSPSADENEQEESAEQHAEEHEVEENHENEVDHNANKDGKKKSKKNKNKAQTNNA